MSSEWHVHATLQMARRQCNSHPTLLMGQWTPGESSAEIATPNGDTWDLANTACMLATTSKWSPAGWSAGCPAGCRPLSRASPSARPGLRPRGWRARSAGPRPRLHRRPPSLRSFLSSLIQCMCALTANMCSGCRSVVLDGANNHTKLGYLKTQQGLHSGQTDTFIACSYSPAPAPSTSARSSCRRINAASSRSCSPLAACRPQNDSRRERQSQPQFSVNVPLADRVRLRTVTGGCSRHGAASYVDYQGVYASLIRCSPAAAHCLTAA